MPKKNANRFTILEAVEASIATRDTTIDLHKLDQDLFIHVRELLPNESFLRNGCWGMVKNHNNIFNLCGNTFDNKHSVFCKAHGMYSAGSSTAIMAMVLNEIGKLSMEKHHAHLQLASSITTDSIPTNDGSTTGGSTTNDGNTLVLQEEITELASSESINIERTDSNQAIKEALERAVTAETNIQTLKDEMNSLRLQWGDLQQTKITLEEENNRIKKEIDTLTNEVYQYKEDSLQYRNLQHAINSLKIKYRRATIPPSKQQRTEKGSASSSSSSDLYLESSKNNDTDPSLLPSATTSLIRELEQQVAALQTETQNNNFIIENQNSTITSLKHEITEYQEKFHTLSSPSIEASNIPVKELSQSPVDDTVTLLRTQCAQEREQRTLLQDQLFALQTQYNQLEESLNMSKMVYESKQMDNRSKQDNEWLEKINELTVTYTMKLKESDALLAEEKKQHKQLQHNLEVQLASLRNQFETKQEQILQMEEVSRGLRMEIELVNNEKESIRKDGEKLLENQRKEWEAVFVEIQNATQQANNEAVSTAETLMATREALQDALVRQSEFTANVSDAQEHTNQLQQQVKELEEKEYTLRHENEQLAKAKEELEYRVQQLTEEIFHIQRNDTESKAQIQAKIVENQVIQEQLSKATNETSHLGTHIENITAQLEASKRYTNELEKQLKDFSSTVTERNLRTLLTDAETKVKTAETHILEIQATNDSLRKQLEEVRNTERIAVTELRELRITENELRIQLSEVKVLGKASSTLTSPLSVSNSSVVRSPYSTHDNNNNNVTTILSSPNKSILSPSLINQLPPIISTPHGPSTDNNSYTPVSSDYPSFVSSSSMSSSAISIPRLEPPTPLSSNWGLHTPEQINSVHNSLTEKKEDTLGSSGSSQGIMNEINSTDTVHGGGVETRNRASMAATLRVEEYMRASAEVDRLSDLRTRLEAITARYTNSGSKLTNSNQKYKVLTPGSLLSSTGLSPASTATAYMLSSPAQRYPTMDPPTVPSPSLGTYAGTRNISITDSNASTINLHNPPSRAAYSSNRDNKSSEETTSSGEVPVRQLHLDG